MRVLFDDGKIHQSEVSFSASSAVTEAFPIVSPHVGPYVPAALAGNQLHLEVSPSGEADDFWPLYDNNELVYRTIAGAARAVPFSASPLAIAPYRFGRFRAKTDAVDEEQPAKIAIRIDQKRV